jgi:succinate dehydrogenase hydrophobic membrane anchor protein
MSSPVDHKVFHNVTTLLNIPLALWFMCSVFSLRSSGLFEFQAWFSQPVNLVVGLLFVMVTLKHFVLEIEVVLEDYISNTSLRNFSIIAIKIFAFVLGLTAILSLLKLGL